LLSSIEEGRASMPIKRSTPTALLKKSNSKKASWVIGAVRLLFF
jgi:hypothetical protein